MITALISFFVVLIVAIVILKVMQQFFPQLPMEIVALILGLIVLVAALRIFGVWGGAVTW